MEKKTKSKALFVCITDTHLKKDNLELVFNVFVQLAEYCLKIRCYKIIHLGDWFNSREEQPIDCLLMCQQIKEYLLLQGLELVTIVGNHDKVDLTKGKSYLDIFNADRFKVVPEYEVISYGSIAVHFLSYFKEGKVYTEKLLEAKKRSEKYSTNILCTHTAISGVQNNNGSIVENENPSGHYNDFNLVLVGHYHNKQKIGSRINYVGSAYQANFGEDEAKGLTVVYDDCTIEQVQLQFPKFKKIVLHVDEHEVIQETLATLSEEKENGSTDNYRVLFCGKKNDVELYDVSSFLNLGVECKKDGVASEVEFEEIEDAELVVFDKGALMEEWIAYTKENKLTPLQLKKGLSLLNEINN